MEYITDAKIYKILLCLANKNDRRQKIAFVRQMLGKKLSENDWQNSLAACREKGFVIEIHSKGYAGESDLFLTDVGYKYLHNPVQFFEDEYFNGWFINIIIKIVNEMKKEKGVEAGEVCEDGLLKLIKEIEAETNSGNYLPIFKVRERVPAVSRESFDHVLRSLWNGGKISLSALYERRHYTEEQIAQGIPQSVDGPLFYIIMRD